jgi:natural product precursor
MKTNKKTKKLALKKISITHLDNNKMDQVKGGTTDYISPCSPQETRFIPHDNCPRIPVPD